MRKFEKISFSMFEKEFNKTLNDYEEILLPKRQTKNSAGYDFYLIDDLNISVNETKIIKTGIKVQMNSDDFLMIVIRSSLGFKYNFRMCNQVGIIDADYYNNPDNEGQIQVAIKNEGTKEVNLKKGDRICQGIFLNYNKTSDDNALDNERVGGIGSTEGKKI